MICDGNTYHYVSLYMYKNNFNQVPIPLDLLNIFVISHFSKAKIFFSSSYYLAILGQEKNQWATK